MYLKELIEKLESLPADKAARFALTCPHSYRGSYDELAFVRKDEPQTAGKMLEIVRSAMGETYFGWKGGEYTMGEYTTVNIANPGECGDEITSYTMLYLFPGETEADLSRNEPQWFTEWPTEPGWYWVWRAGEREAIPGYVKDARKVYLDGQLVLGNAAEVMADCAWCRIEPPDLDGARKALGGEG